MRPRPVLLWVVATVAATAVAWAAVDRVAARTVEPLPAGVALPDGVSTEGDTAPSPVATAPGSPDPAVTSDPTPMDPTTERPANEEPTEVTRSYQLIGGDVTVSFSPEAVEVISVTPRPGFLVEDIDRRGATEVEVDLRSDDARSRLRVWWGDGPRHRIDEDD